VYTFHSRKSSIRRQVKTRASGDSFPAQLERMQTGLQRNDDGSTPLLMMARMGWFLPEYPLEPDENEIQV
jgi:hypothetical protein